MFVNIVGAVGAPFWAFFGDMSYSILFTVAIVLMVVVLLLGIFCFGKMKGLAGKGSRIHHPGGLRLPARPSLSAEYFGWSVREQ